jgi:hypothetical protein
MEIGVEATMRHVMSVAHTIAELSALAAEIAAPCHFFPPKSGFRMQDPEK